MNEISNEFRNVQHHNIDPYVLVDEMSNTEIYIGTSRTFNDRSGNIWRIKRYWKIGNVWFSGFPNGNQDFMYKWDDRLSYSYM